MPIPLPALALTATLLIPVADAPPQFDPRPGCRAGADSGVVTKPDVDACVRSEEQARDQLKAQWTSFPGEAKGRCVAKTYMGGPPSYIEVLVCLDLARAVKNMPKDDTTGLDTGLRR